MSVVSDPEYVSFSSNKDLSRATGVHLLAPDQLASAIENLTGFSMDKNGDSLLDYQYRSLSGGVDGRQTFQTQRMPSLTTALVLKRMAEKCRNLGCSTRFVWNRRWSSLRG